MGFEYVGVRGQSRALARATTHKLAALRRQTVRWVGCGFFCALIPLAQAQSPDLTQLSLDDLMKLDVTSVSKKEQKIAQIPAAVFVITAEDIRRSGALVLPDLLRMVPGVDVGQLDGSNWAISARGFNAQYSNKLLVMLDGQSIYTTLFGGVFWNTVDVPLESIQRIEVIRGPGAAVWGVNAVNGVINIITKKSSESQGGLVSLSSGPTAWDSQGPDRIRYGGKLGDSTTYSVDAHGFHYPANPSLAGGPSYDHWQVVGSDFRADSRLSARDALTVEGRAVQSKAGEIFLQPVLYPPTNIIATGSDQSDCWSLMARWDRTLPANSATSLQISFSRDNRRNTMYDLGLNLLSADFQHRFHWMKRQDLVWGLGFSVSSDNSAPGQPISFNPAAQVLKVFSGFVQDEIAVRPNLALTLGARLEHNDYTNFDLQPTVRLAWSPRGNSTYWAAVSGADRTPARADTGVAIINLAVPLPGNLPTGLVIVLGNPQQKNEQLKAFELGARHHLGGRLSVDTTVFYGRYRDLEADQVGPPYLAPSPPPHLILPDQFSNGAYGENHGVETFANWRVSKDWTLSPGYAYYTEHMHLFAPPLGFAPPSIDWVGCTPDHAAQLRSSVSLPLHLQWNTSSYFVDRLPVPAIPSYTRLDSGILWQATERIAFSAYGQNLLRDRHLEFINVGPNLQSTLMRRGAYAKLTWSF
jgi:iron complex outermembrane recepter protein